MGNLQLVLASLLDSDDSGNVTPHEIEDFFLEIWDNEDIRRDINKVSKEIAEDQTDSKRYLLIKQFCIELGLDYYFETLKSKGITSNMFLTSSYESLRSALKEIDAEHISLLYLKAQEHNIRKKFYFDIRDQGIIIRDLGIQVAAEVERAYHDGKLKEATRNND